jgi:virginiamycin B lyase
MAGPVTGERSFKAAVGEDRLRRRGPLVLAALLVFALAFAPRADAFVYWANNGAGTIGRANLDGTGVNQNFIINLSGPGGVAVDDAHIYWAANEGGQAIGRANLDGSGVDHSFIPIASQPTEDPSWVAVDSTHIYWAGESLDAIGRARVNGTGVDHSFVDTGGQGIAVDDGHIYFAKGMTIGRSNLNGTNPQNNFITGADDPKGVAVDSTHVYWANQDADTIGRANLNGSNVNQSFIAGADCGVAVDATHVYWGNSDDPDTVGRANLDGLGVEPSFIGGVERPCGVAVDSGPLPPRPPPGGPPPPGEPLNDISFGKVKKNQRKGTAKLTVNVPGAGELELAKTKKVKPDDESAEDAGKEKLSIKPKGKAKKKLNRKGKAKMKAEVTFTPDGGTPNTEDKKIKLVKR